VGRAPVPAGLAALIAAFAGARAMAAFWFSPQYSEFAHFHYPFAALSDWGLYPFVHYWLEYPPLFPWVSVGVYRILGWVWATNTPEHLRAFVVALQCLMALVDVVNALLIYRLAARTGRAEQASLAALAFCLSFLTGFVGAGFFDGLVLLFVLLGVYGLAEGRPVLGGIALGLGVITKIMPIALIPVGWKFGSGKPVAVARFLAAAAIVVALVWGSFALVSPDLAVMPIRANGVRPPWETVWAVAEGQFQFGYLGPERLGETRTEDHALARIVSGVLIPGAGQSAQFTRERLISRFSTDLSAFPRARFPRFYLACGLLVLGLFVATWRHVDPARPDRLVSYAFFLFMLFLLYSKGWSPQFAVFPVAFLLIEFPSVSGVWAALALVTLNFLEMPVWAYYVRLQPEGPAVLTGIVLARTTFLGVLTWKFWVRSRADAR
jgi:hypothetical protein